MPNTRTDRRQANLVPAIANNLRYLCGLRKSTSEVCRSIGINRQQFNKYLSGSTIPSTFNLGRISAYFGLDDDALRRPSAEFRRTLPQPEDVPPNPIAAPSLVHREIYETAISLATLNPQMLRPYVGLYFRYNYAFDSSGRIVRGLFRVSETGGLFVTRLVERVQHRSNGSTKLTTLKYDGVLAALSGCLFNVEFERLMKSCVGHAAFPCIMRPGQRFLTGIQSSFSSSTGRPAASRVVLERAGQGMDVREMLGQCGTFRRNEGAIDPDVLKLIGNRVYRDADPFSPPRV